MKGLSNHKFNCMRFLVFSILVVSFSFFSCKSEDTKSPVLNTTKPEVVFDSIRAQKVGADDYGMRQYVMAFLKSGPNRDRTKEESDKLQRAHMDNIGRLSKAGKLILAGPFMSDGDLRGIYIFDVKTELEAKKLVETDPAIQQGSLIMELVPWYGSAALMEVNEIHKAIAKLKF